MIKFVPAMKMLLRLIFKYFHPKYIFCEDISATKPWITGTVQQIEIPLFRKGYRS